MNLVLISLFIPTNLMTLALFGHQRDLNRHLRILFKALINLSPEDSAVRTDDTSVNVLAIYLPSGIGFLGECAKLLKSLRLPIEVLLTLDIFETDFFSVLGKMDRGFLHPPRILWRR